jgi:hypothetical protein
MEYRVVFSRGADLEREVLRREELVKFGPRKKGLLRIGAPEKQTISSL